MKRIVSVFLVISICLLSGVCWAQYYYNGYVYPYPPAYNSSPPPSPQGPQYQIQRPQQPGGAVSRPWGGLGTIFRSKSAPQIQQDWNRNNRVDDFLELHRGTLHRESDLEYMMRTF